jgi:hypothetical protein
MVAQSDISSIDPMVPAGGDSPAVFEDAAESLPRRWARRMQEVNRRVRRWLPSSSDMALFAHDFRRLEAGVYALQGAIARLDAAMEEWSRSESPETSKRVEEELGKVDAAVVEFDLVAREAAYADAGLSPALMPASAGR